MDRRSVQGPDGLRLTVLSGGYGYSVAGVSRELAILPDFRLPSQVGLDPAFDALFDGDEDYGGVAPYVPVEQANALERAFRALRAL